MLAAHGVEIVIHDAPRYSFGWRGGRPGGKS